MKISKLFHWLYAALMFLPLALICGRTLYTIFNNNAKDSYSDYKSINYTVINNSSGVINGRTYLLQYKNNNVTTTEYSPNFYYSSIDIDWSDYGFDEGLNVDYFTIRSDGYVYLYLVGGSVRLQNIWGSTLTSIIFDLSSWSAPQNINKANTQLYDVVILQGSLDNAFTYSLNEINTNPIFSWATNTYISQPLTYVTGLFGLQTNNPINTLISYWFSVSIFWLIFDIMMYLPMMVHRWLDKASIS